MAMSRLLLSAAPSSGRTVALLVEMNQCRPHSSPSSSSRPPSPSTRRRPTSSTPARSPGPERDGRRIQDSACRRRRQRHDSFAPNHHHHSKTGRTTTRGSRYGRQGRLGCRTPRYVVETDSARRWCGGWSHFRLGRRLAGQLSHWSWFWWMRGFLSRRWSCLSARLGHAHLAGLVSSTTYPSPPIGNHHPSRLAHLASPPPDTHARTATEPTSCHPTNFALDVLTGIEILRRRWGEEARDWCGE
ncbi:hypothetical protein FB45DRAFT_917560 [Roridomyces roridus]|uniref:Uncharacterized protein n=1 Tax=Roridomyces roridus TaxID=1738132 RepID=A0AAD7BV22_9AGAR|nr:hypothetical protein FB45DRAFT_917560 [Roridomyces roridus]